MDSSEIEVGGIGKLLTTKRGGIATIFALAHILSGDPVFAGAKETCASPTGDNCVRACKAWQKGMGNEASVNAACSSAPAPTKTPAPVPSSDTEKSTPAPFVHKSSNSVPSGRKGDIEELKDAVKELKAAQDAQKTEASKSTLSWDKVAGKINEKTNFFLLIALGLGWMLDRLRLSKKMKKLGAGQQYIIKTLVEEGTIKDPSAGATEDNDEE